MSNPISIAVVGAGYWGRNYVRNFNSLPDARLSWVCDVNNEARERATRMAPGARITHSLEEVLTDPDVQGVVIATNAIHHHAHAMAALSAGKHVLVEKPMATSLAHAEEMIEQAKDAARVLMVGHLMLYHSAVEKLQQIIQSGDLGRIYYLYAQRVNLGRIRHDENALWSFAPHDLSIILSLLPGKVETVWARGECYLQPGIEDVVFVNLRFGDHTMAQIQLSWLDPHKERRLTVVGSKKMVVFDDNHATEKLRIFDKGFDRPPEYDSYGDYLSIRNGDIHIPHINLAEPLTVECRHFLHCITHNLTPRTDGQNGLKVVRILAAAQQSLKEGGAPIPL